ncbi:MAG: nicotinate (nicotinamide) nucleotide adenylyltransferase [Acidobacteria bacterium RIFCSPLOWO2_12_FULL_67_14]|nr:MAG: nicotinate (nicotinamide) nucleotide adenylyltransferase [Acidobacteria bacterium RIFCSPLOWO2_02_FULL_67_21]OFW38113.1 MAG: nicotinate (nicotinamide) nucleotide adenylyltransferase [Acidobacteria bacterium RIFCSPLOWO2_12_FULL_67_14]
MMRHLGVLGGTFDPIHSGHLDLAAAARSALALSEVVFVPSHDPPHRAADPHASAFHRFALVALAIDGHPGYRVSDRELARQGRSYTADTLDGLHAEGWAPSQLFFILGADAFAEIATWHAYPAVLDAAHFVVVARPGTTLEQALARTPDLMRRAHPAPGPADAGASTRILLVEARTREISSTMIRRRLAARQPIDGFVPAAVAQHIAAHRLYQTPSSPETLEDNPLETDLHGGNTNIQGA